MAGSFAIIAALPRELVLLTKGLQPDPTHRKRGITLYRSSGAVLVAAGMGSARASLAFEAALQVQSIDTVLSVGLAGACDPGTEPGTVLEAAHVVDVRTGERFATSARGQASAVLATAEAIASVQEKARLRAAYKASMVDMEAATLARLSIAQGLAFRAIKGISDAHDFELASMSRFTGKQGSFRTGAFALHVALRPNLWEQAMTLGRSSQQALKQLSEQIKSILTETA